MMRLQPSRAILASFALSLGAVAVAQTPATDTLFIQTGVGSFKILPPGPDKTRGTLDINFEGTVMVSGLTGTVTPGPGVRLELERKDHNRKVFFGKGHIRVSGEFRAIQFFGRNLKGSYSGIGIARLYGEFDKNMETGYFWYASQPEKVDWGAYGRTLVVPPAKAGPVAPRGKVRDVPAGKAG
ncbi:hypothetical protein EON82_05355 [bacterium]|nr:MAG: hypothetical protein EON82_05355 [bacterium]